MNLNMKCPECRGSNILLMELDNDLRKTIRKVAGGRIGPDAISVSKARKAAAVAQIGSHITLEHAEVAA